MARQIWAVILFSLTWLAGCAPGPTPVTGQSSAEVTYPDNQSETATNVSNTGGKQIITITYNDKTDSVSTIVYTTTDRIIKTGASLMGWSNSTDGGKNWNYGGKVSPPDGWAALWGDPAIATWFNDQRYVFLSNLAIPASKMPAEGASGNIAPYLGGACLARSVDGGFTFSNYKCVDNNHHFYDGASLAISQSGEVYAAYIDWDMSKIDVWRSPSINGTFTLLPDPFPGITMSAHARLRTWYDTPYVAAQAANGWVWINRYSGGSWGKAVNISQMAAELYPSVKLSKGDLRTGPQYSYDIGAASDWGDDPIRMLYTARDGPGGRLYVRGAYCPLDLTACKDAPEWGTTPGNLNLEGDQFDPNVRAFPGFLTISPAWQATYLSREHDVKGNSVSVKHGALAVLPNQGPRVLLPFDVATNLDVCSYGTYWGDYNDLQFAGFAKDSTNAQFLVAFSDSSKGCVEQGEWKSRHLHVSTAMVP